MLGSEDLARASLYRRLAALESAGIPVLTSIERLLEDGDRTARLLEPVRQLLAGGEDLPTAFAKAPGLSRFEAQVVAVGARAGALPDAFQQVADMFEERARASRELAAGLAYPVVLAHLALLLPNVAVWVKDGTGAFLVATAVPLAVVYGLGFALVAAFRAARRADAVRADAALLRLPLLGPSLGAASLATSLRALRALYGAGTPITAALEGAADVAPNRAAGQVFERLRRAVDRDGLELPQAILMQRELPGTVADLLSSGAQAGKLEEALDHAARLTRDEAAHRRKLLLAGSVTAAMVLAMGYGAYRVISFWAGYFAELNRHF